MANAISEGGHGKVQFQGTGFHLTSLLPPQRAPLGENAELDNEKNKKLGLVISLSIFALFSYVIVNSFDGKMNITEGTSTQVLGEILLTRFVYPFEIVSFVLLAALIGGITLARKDNALIDEDQV